MTERTALVALNTEESGWLCHLLLPHVQKLEGQPRERMLALYDKLTQANDYCMGKRDATGL